jgi:hypothetical protein
LAILIVLTRANLAHVYASTVATCTRYRDCGQADATFSALDSKLQVWLNIVVVVVPGVLGIFWGAPLIAGDLETGTYRVAWTQSVSRTRWFVIKIALVGAASIAVAGLVSLLVTWWSSMFDHVTAYEYSVFDARDIVPMAYAAFAFALGVGFGTVLKKTLPAMALTLVGFVGVRVAILEWVRPRYLAPLKVFSPALLPGPNGPVAKIKGLSSSDWIISEQTVDGAGKVIASLPAAGRSNNLSLNIVPSGAGVRINPSGVMSLTNGQVCPNRVPASALGLRSPGQFGPGPRIVNAVQECLAKLNIRELWTYQPSSRYWPFQWFESGLVVMLAILLAGLCVWSIRRKAS